MNEPALRLLPDVDPETGEVLENAPCAECVKLRGAVFNKEQELRAVEKDLRAWRRKHERLLADKDDERLADPRRDEILQVFDHWRERCNHQNSRFDGKRFDLIKARLRDFTADELKMAVDGAAVDAYVDPKGKRHDRLGLILESAERVEDFCNRYARWQRTQEAA